MVYPGKVERAIVFTVEARDINCPQHIHQRFSQRQVQPVIDQLRDPDYPGKVERAIVFTVEAWDINCHQHIHKRFSQREIQPVIDELRGRIAELEEALAKLRSGDV